MRSRRKRAENEFLSSQDRFMMVTIGLVMVAIEAVFIFCSIITALTGIVLVGSQDIVFDVIMMIVGVSLLIASDYF